MKRVKQPKILFFLLFTLIITLFSCSPSREKVIQPLAERGLLDLSNFDLEKNKYISLNGDWRYYKNISLKNTAIEDLPPATDFATFPDFLRNKNNIDKSLPVTGDTTYHLRLKVHQKYDTIGFSFKNMTYRSTIFINGREVPLFRSALIASEPEERTFITPLTNVQPNNGYVDIVMSLSNAHNTYERWGGEIYAGLPFFIHGKRYLWLSFQLLLIGAMVNIALHHLSLFLMRRKDKSSLYYALICLNVSAYTLVTGEKIILFLMPALETQNLPRLIFFCVYSSIPLYSLVINSLFPDEFKPFVIKLSAFISLAFIISLMGPHYIFLNSMAFFTPFLAIFVAYIFYSISLSVIRKKDRFHLKKNGSLYPVIWQ